MKREPGLITSAFNGVPCGSIPGARARGGLRFFRGWHASAFMRIGWCVMSKVENRSRLGVDRHLVPAAGTDCLTVLSSSDVGIVFTIFYWGQALPDNRLGFAPGSVDVTDDSDTYGLVHRWTDSRDFALSSGSTTPVPRQGAGVRWMSTPHSDCLVGVADLDGDPPRLFGSSGVFLDALNVFEHPELGGALASFPAGRRRGRGRRPAFPHRRPRDQRSAEPETRQPLAAGSWCRLKPRAGGIPERTSR